MAGLVPAIHESVAAGPASAQCSPMESAWVYIMTNRPNGTLYTGVTSNLARRVYEHREGLIEGFTKRYGLKRLVYCETHADISAAIQREHNMKHWPRKWKVRLILSTNPDWSDLYDRLV
jgi:putative endonuclease